MTVNELIDELTALREHHRCGDYVICGETVDEERAPVARIFRAPGMAVVLELEVFEEGEL